MDSLKVYSKFIWKINYMRLSYYSLLGYALRIQVVRWVRFQLSPRGCRWMFGSVPCYWCLVSDRHVSDRYVVLSPAFLLERDSITYPQLTLPYISLKVGFANPEKVTYFIGSSHYWFRVGIIWSIFLMEIIELYRMADVWTVWSTCDFSSATTLYHMNLTPIDDIGLSVLEW